MRLVIANLALRALLAFYQLISNRVANAVKTVLNTLLSVEL